MLTKLRKRLHLTPATAIAALALMFAMTGGAYAAGKYVITSTKQISPKVLKSLTGKAGANGAAGKPGANGANGAAGPQGPAGAAGARGAAGEPGEPGKAGERGLKGETGSPWTAGGKLPSGATETGAWSHRFEGLEAGTATEPISFTIPLAAALTEGHAHYVSLEEVNRENGEAPPAGCQGSAQEPTAAAGELCVYEGFAKLPSAETTPVIGVIGIVSPSKVDAVSTFEAGTAGAVAIVKYEEGPEGGNAYVQGSWAVTAP